ncbi:MalY/PatB family protein [Nocardioides insulae]|uniref:MalY/PatB family protein n=1 Tax=Nocardioides insulae TaxID=394734 RepID=UPI0004119EAA|nr:aminotransferase class I/II-fold pyridoxal phosphate-dependent enzyme [Nocardioides insulae]
MTDLLPPQPASPHGSDDGVAPDFDAITVADLRRTGGLKWRAHPDALGAFVAEMDFGLADPILEAVTGTARDGLTGYPPEWLTDDLRTATAAWQRDRYSWSIDPHDVTPTADVIHAYEIAIRHFSRPGSPVVLLTPAYYPFFSIAETIGRETIEVPLHLDERGWTLDLDELDRALAAGGGLVVLCHPHNPIGKVYDRNELLAIAEVVERHDARVFSDEVHAPLVYAGTRHIPYATISDTAAAHALTATSASKAFNLPGLKCGQIITSNPADRTLVEELGMTVSHGASTLGIAANTAAYRRGGAWLASVVDYLDGNRHHLTGLLAEHLPEVRMHPPAATYFGWLDVRGVGIEGSPGDFFLEHAKVALNDGEPFGQVGSGHVRLNFATPRPILTRIIEAMSAALEGRRRS